MEIPIEICPTSNMKTMGLASLNKHPVVNTIMGTTPTSMNTDDMVVFDICLSDEYWAIAQMCEWDIQKALQYVEQLVLQILDSLKSSENV